MHITRSDNSGHPGARSTRTGAPRRAARSGLTALLAAVAAAATLALAGATPASASTLNGVATISAPGGTTPLTSGGSNTLYTVALPAQAACDADTATHGYHVYSYLEKKGTALSGVTFIGSPSVGLGLFDNTGTYYGAANTAIGTGQIVSIPNNFEWGAAVAGGQISAAQLLYTGSGSTASGIWEAGLACANSSGVLADNWNTEITFNASAGDPHGFTWTTASSTVTFHVVTTALSPATATIGTAYKGAALTATGGTLPYKWKITTGKLPKGLKLNATTAVISGTVKASKTAPAPGPYTFTVTVTDKSKPKKTATATFTLTLAA